MAAKKEEVALDFEGLYQTYPRRVGKKAGMIKLKQLVKTPEEYAKFKRALENYIAQLIAHKTEMKYIKHWQTFVNQYEDYIEVQTTPPNGPLDQLQRILNGDL